MEYRMSWMPFVENCHKFFEEGKINGFYPLIEAIDELYRIGPEKSPFLPAGAPGDEQSRIFAKCFFVCHRTFLSAAMAIGSGLPEDGEAVTRRALEAAKTCLAVKADAANLEAWLSGEKRLERWRQRGQGEIPKNLAVHFTNVKGEPLYDELQTAIGELSDFGVHFTPEYFWRYSWEETPLPGGARDFSFGLNVGAIEMAFLMLSKHYELIFRVFDRCEDGRMLMHQEVERAHQFVIYLHQKFHALVKPTLEALISGAMA
jgi:hypothetical protein